MTKEEAVKLMRDNPGLICRVTLGQERAVPYLLYKSGEGGNLYVSTERNPAWNASIAMPDGVWSIEEPPPTPPKDLTRFDFIG